MIVHALCMLCIAVYTIVHAFSIANTVYNVYECVCYVYCACLSVHGHTRFGKFVQGGYFFCGSSTSFFLGRLSDDEKANIGAMKGSGKTAELAGWSNKESSRQYWRLCVITYAIMFFNQGSKHAAK